MLYVAGLAGGRLAGAARRWRRTRPVLVTLGALIVGAGLIVQLGVVWPQTFESALGHTQTEQPAPPPTTAAVPAPPTAPLPLEPPAPTPPPALQQPTSPVVIPPAICGARAGDAAHPGRPTMLEDVLCGASGAGPDG
jgi:hypothetical protein